ncbi:MAG: DNA polymerase III subunit delta' [Bacillota bacterium]
MYDVVRGQDAAIIRLKTAARLGKVAHAYLFTGPPGVGKGTTAKAFAAALFCDEEAGTGEACGRCPQCRMVNGAGHPDLHEVNPDGASIGIDQIRAAVFAVGRKPYRRRHVVIIDQAELCTAEAQNAFLKTLEEPPGETVFILVSARPEALLPTVVSRCCEVRFHRLKPEIIAGELVQRHGAPEKEARVLAVLAGGSMSRAIELMDPKVAALKEKALEMAMKPALAKVQEIVKNNKVEKTVAVKGLEFFSLWYRDLLLYRFTKDPGLVINADHLAEVEKAGLPLKNLLAAAEAVEDGKKMLRANVNPRLVLEGLVVRLSSVLNRIR